MAGCVARVALVAAAAVALEGTNATRNATKPPKHVVPSLYRNATLHGLPWAPYAVALVGGYHFSGTSVVAKLLATQPWALGLDATGFWGELPGCAKKHCSAPEDEGAFLTKVFQPTQTRFLGCAHAADWTNSGRCGAVVHAAAEKLAAADLGAARRDLARDWAPFWRGCGNATQYLVAKDILTLYRAPLLRSIFGASRAAFVYVLRHPLAHCVVAEKAGPSFHAGRCATDWGADEWARERVRAWLDAHDLCFRDARRSERAAAFQLERLLAEPRAVLARVARVLALDAPRGFAYHYLAGRRLGLERGSLERGLVQLAARAPAKISKLPELRQLEPDDVSRLAAYCYAADALAPVRAGACGDALLVDVRARPPAVDGAAPRCGWTATRYKHRPLPPKIEARRDAHAPPPPKKHDAAAHKTKAAFRLAAGGAGDDPGHENRARARPTLSPRHGSRGPDGRATGHGRAATGES